MGYFLASPVQLSVSDRSLSKLCFWHLSSLIGVFFFCYFWSMKHRYQLLLISIKIYIYIYIYTILVLVKVFKRVGFSVIYWLHFKCRFKIIHVRKLRFNVLISNNLN